MATTREIRRANYIIGILAGQLARLTGRKMKDFVCEAEALACEIEQRIENGMVKERLRATRG